MENIKLKQISGFKISSVKLNISNLEVRIEISILMGL